MNKRIPRLIAGAAFLLVLALADSAPAQPPTYLLLSRPPTHVFAPPAHATPPAYGLPVQASPYAYGWFGARPHAHWSRHYGYFGNYTEWSPR